jgi:hypothetical protein
MHSRLVFSVSLVFVACSPVKKQAAPGIPPGVRSMLDSMHAEWRIAAVSDEVRSAVGERLGETPNVVAGDFDGNGCTDVALLFEYPNVDDPHAWCTHFVELIAFLATEKGYEAIPLRRRYVGPDPWSFLTLRRGGDRCIDFFREKSFELVHDSIGWACYGKASGVYMYENRTFRYVSESD